MTTPNNPSVYTIVLVRHGESTGNVENRLQGLSDFPLSETGRAQAHALADRWLAEGPGFDTAISSPLSRAAETARILVETLSIPALELEPLWVERDMGGRSGMTINEIRAQFQDPEFLNPYDTYDQRGESDWALYLRAGQAIHRILQRPPARYLVVAHGAILNMTLYAILGIAPQPNFQGPRFGLENTAFASFRYHPNTHRWRVGVIGDRTHWPLKNSSKSIVPLQPDFYERPTLVVARELLGARLMRILDGERLSGIITETEAYIGEDDLACHARAGRTPRTRVMYGPPGRAYVYFTYGMHWMLNAVTEAEGFPAAVLIRAVRVVEGREVVAARRAGVKPAAWTDGPAKLARAFGIDGVQNELDLTKTASGLWLEAGFVISDANVTIGPRVGLYNVPEPSRSLPWRFLVTGSSKLEEAWAF